MTDPNRPAAQGISPGRGTAVLPMLPPATGPLDPVAIATWHLALSDAVRQDLPHELLALWLFPAAGGVVLLGPAALAEDDLTLDRPEPFLTQEQLLTLEERVRRAGYASVIAAPVRDHDRDLGLMLLAALSAGQYGPIQAMRLFDLLRHLAHPFRELADRAPAEPNGLTLAESPDGEALMARVAAIAAEARSGSELVTRMSAVVHAAMPHDELVVLVPTATGEGWEWLGCEGTKRRWRSARTGTSDLPAGLGVLRERLAQASVLAIRDLAAERDGLAWPGQPDRPDHPRIRAMLAATLLASGDTAGYLMLGSVARDLYRPADEARMRAIADLIGPAVAALTWRQEALALRRMVRALEGPGGALAKVVRRLATVAHFGEATREVDTVLRALTDASASRFVLRLGDTEAVAVVPGELRPLLDLPLLVIEGSSFAPVLRGEAPMVLLREGPVEELVLPLRLAGRPFGVMILSGPAGGRLASVTLGAQQVADAIAPHLELLRREAGREARSNS
ncbi:MAG TPA: hypothetical protein VMK53_02215 [Gemmatimonadales bacterium]|nr:hypothetical protein [Gemmatimonadales bacterium]